MNDERLRQLAREKLDGGELPRRSAGIWGCEAADHRCALCGEPIAGGSVEIEERTPEGGTLFFHGRCHAVVTTERG
ncbi:MAG TPA: hypothetical protein VM369_09445 [Candidatus Binatia bacterium]|nr:hypothetical protein [Candidatus Binatia bacterium]